MQRVMMSESQIVEMIFMVEIELEAFSEFLECHGELALDGKYISRKARLEGILKRLKKALEAEQA